MVTLYELLGALPRDDAEELRVAFRRAVKGSHPDLRPGDPDAGMKFRQIVRANQILSDNDQRAAYDHLLQLAHHEKDPAAAHPIAAKVHKIASTVVAMASVSVLTATGYFLFMHMSMALAPPAGSLAAHAPPSAIDLTSRLTASIAAVSPADAPDPAAVNAFIAAKTEGFAANAMAMATPDADNTPPSGSTVADQGSDNTAVSHPHESSLAAIGDVGAIAADAGRVAQLDETFTTPYVDRGILFFREKKDDRPFPELAPLKRADKNGHSKSVIVSAGKSHDPAPQDALPKVVPLPVPRTQALRIVRPRPEPWYAASAGFQ
jgi:curved DNA-binding protein CbpA